MITKKLILPVVAIIAAGGILTFNVSKVNAQTNTPRFGLVQAIASKFNLDQTQVQTVVDQYRQTEKQNRGNEMRNNHENQLAKLVTEGKITEVQKQAIVAEITTLRAKYSLERSKNLTPTERKAQMEKHQAEIKTWAQSQGIDPTLVTLGKGRY